MLNLSRLPPPVAVVVMSGGAAMAMMRCTVDVPRERTMPIIETMINRTSATSPMRAPIGMVMSRKIQAPP